MVTISAKIQNKDCINRFVKKFPTVIEKSVKSTAVYGKAEIMKYTPVKTGQTRRAWFMSRLSAFSYGIFNALDHALYLEYGTGIYGPKRRLIVPLTKKFLKFPIIKGNTIRGWVQKKFVKGFLPFGMIRHNKDKIYTRFRQNLIKNIKATWGSAKAAGAI